MRTVQTVGYRRGERVEVASNAEGFVGSYYEATVVEELPGGKGYIVQYNTLVKDDLSGPLREAVRAAEFHMDEAVDVFDNDGWWVGRISGKLGSRRYYVSFHSPGDIHTLIYPKHRIRVHLHWDRHAWISNLQSF